LAGCVNDPPSRHIFSAERPSGLAGTRRLNGARVDQPRVNEWLGEHVPERLRPDVLLAATAIFRARAGTGIVKAQVVAAAADGLGLGRGLKGGAPLLRQISLGGDNLQAPGVMALEGTAGHGADDEDEPPVVQDVHHAAIFPQW